MHAEVSGVRGDTGGVDLARNDELQPVPVLSYLRTSVNRMIAEVVLGLTENAIANKRGNSSSCLCRHHRGSSMRTGRNPVPEPL
jgi:hypothetical protein